MTRSTLAGSTITLNGSDSLALSNTLLLNNLDDNWSNDLILGATPASSLTITGPVILGLNSSSFASASGPSTITLQGQSD